jgi:hypothetical protein
MKKLVIVALSAVLAVMAIEPAHAQDQKVLAIIDTAIDSQEVKSVIHEVCFTQNKSCPNKTNFMEGVGSAASPVWPSSISHPVYHGHNMAQSALLSDPTIKIVFVRIANINSSDLASINAELSLVQAVEWVSQNASKYSIDAVTISQSRTTESVKALQDAGYKITSTVPVQRFPVGYCPNNLRLNGAVQNLNNQKITTFAATGNDGLSNIVGFPSCAPGVIGVGSVKPNLSGLANDTNRGVGLDIIASGTMSVLRYKMTKPATISGTSVSTQIAASIYIKNNVSLGFDKFLNGLPRLLGYGYISN